MQFIKDKHKFLNVRSHLYKSRMVDDWRLCKITNQMNKCHCDKSNCFINVSMVIYKTSTVIQFYLAVRLLLKYCVQFWDTTDQEECEPIEKIQEKNNENNQRLF